VHEVTRVLNATRTRGGVPREHRHVEGRRKVGGDGDVETRGANDGAGDAYRSCRAAWLPSVCAEAPRRRYQVLHDRFAVILNGSVTENWIVDDWYVFDVRPDRRSRRDSCNRGLEARFPVAETYLFDSAETNERSKKMEEMIRRELLLP